MPTERRSRRFWAMTVDRYHQSRLSQTDFAARYEVNVATLRSWISRIKAERAQPKASERAEPETTSERTNERPEPVPTALDDVLVAAAREHGGLTTIQVERALGVPKNRARQYLQWLVEEGRLVVEGEHKKTRYRAPHPEGHA